MVYAKHQTLPHHAILIVLHQAAIGQGKKNMKRKLSQTQEQRPHCRDGFGRAQWVGVHYVCMYTAL